VPTGLVNAAFTIPALVSRRHPCHGVAMAGDRQKKPRAGGALLAGGILAGTAAGVVAGEPSIGIIAGAIVGLLASAWIWWRDGR
jgi:hypothetical protein